MKKIALGLLAMIVLSGIWVAINLWALTSSIGLTPVAPTNDTPALISALQDKITSGANGNAAMAVLSRGNIAGTVYTSKGKPVSGDSQFGVASLSKWVTAVGVMTLVEQGKVDLDTPVSTYLKRWQLPDTEFDNDQVTLRRLLSHTAGIHDGLGHNGFPPGTPVQPLTEHLTQAADADPGKSGKVIVTSAPGEWDYSGGSYNLTQLIIEDVSGQSFRDYMQQHVLAPLGMSNSQFGVNRESPLLVDYYGENGNIVAYPSYTSLGATGFYSTINDLAKFAAAQLPSTVAPSDSKRLLSDQSLATMRAPVAAVSGLEIWGAGVMLFADTANGSKVYGHGGKSPYLNSSVRLNPETGNGFIMLETGNDDAFSSDMATRWTVWETGNPDMYVINSRVDGMVMRILVGIVVIVLATIITLVFMSRQKKKAAARG